MAIQQDNDVNGIFVFGKSSMILTQSIEIGWPLKKRGG